jgi:hypothetical protein
MVPLAEIHSNTFLTFFLSSVGSWTPTFMGRECCFARLWRPRTKGEEWRGRQRERDSEAELAM